MAGLSGDVLEGMAFFSLSLFLFVIAKFVNEFLTPYDDRKELGAHQNIAVSVSMAGYLIAVTLVLLGAMLGPSKNFLRDIYGFLNYSILGIAFLNLSRIINDKFLLKKFCNVKELVEDRNVGAGTVEFGSYVASGLVVAGAIHGQGGSVVTATVFFLMSQVALILFAFLYDLVTPFDLHKEIDDDNAAAGIAFGGTLVALGIILLKGSAGDFVGWRYNLVNFFASVILCLVFLPLARLLLDKVLIPKIDLNREISENRNVAIGIIEMTVAISLAVFLYFSIEIRFDF